MNSSVLVIGGGIAGIQASLDLADMGFKVYLVERTPSIGGIMALLDKTFPTNDCAMCILAPKMIELSRNSKINLLTYSEVEHVVGELGRFRVKIRKKARSVDEGKCTGCSDCWNKCPIRLDSHTSELMAGLYSRPAIYLPFPQAIPKVPVIDRELCTYFLTGKCGLCEKVCQAGAIDYNQEDEIIDTEVGAIILATGLDFYDISILSEYGYGRIANVITAMEYEKLSSASGPAGGELKRPSDGKIPSNIAFIQCVGSRDLKNIPYCSSVCCMHATKEAMLACEHHPGTMSTIFYIDLRAVGKQFQEYVARAEQEYNVNYIRGRPGRIDITLNANPVIWYEDTITGETKLFETELVVLSQALTPSQGIKQLAGVLGIDLTERSFVEVADTIFHPLDTTRPGIFACGYVHSPRDIPDSIVQASAAAARVAEVMAGGA